MAFVRNVGSVDKIIRLAVGAGAAAWGLLSVGLSSTMGVVALIVGAVLILTAVLNFCPLFRLLGISSFRSSN